MDGNKTKKGGPSVLAVALFRGTSTQQLDRPSTLNPQSPAPGSENTLYVFGPVVTKVPVAKQTCRTPNRW